jgi:hypothetical protein
MVEVEAHGDMRIFFRSAEDQMAQKRIAGIGPRAAACLQDDRRVGRIRGSHDGLDIFEIVHIEGRQRVIVLRRVVEQLPQCDQCHS